MNIFHKIESNNRNYNCNKNNYILDLFTGRYKNYLSFRQELIVFDGVFIEIFIPNNDMPI